jgi:hypothetical protein
MNQLQQVTLRVQLAMVRSLNRIRNFREDGAGLGADGRNNVQADDDDE